MADLSIDIQNKDIYDATDIKIFDDIIKDEDLKTVKWPTGVNEFLEFKIEDGKIQCFSPYHYQRFKDHFDEIWIKTNVVKAWI